MNDETTSVTLRQVDGPTGAGITIIEMDDGKANALGHDMLGALTDALNEAEAADADALVIVGRPGRFSAGFDLSAMQGGGETREMLAAGVDLFLRIYQFPRPVVVACTGHAIAAGAIIRHSGRLEGLTTGAGMWLAGAIGLACGAGFIGIAALVTLLALVIMVLFKWVERYLPVTDDDES